MTESKITWAMMGKNNKISIPDYQHPIISKTIMKHPLVELCVDAAGEGFCEEYKWTVYFIEGYRIGGWETHFKNFRSVRDFKESACFIERCPPDCDCGHGQEEEVA